MMRIIRELRLIPVVLLATASLAVLKMLGLLLDGGYLLTDADIADMDRPIHIDRDPATGAIAVADNTISMPQPEGAWAKWMMGLPDVTGAVPEKPSAERSGINLPPKVVKPPDGKVVQLDAKPVASPSERAILERLQERRQELDSRDREIELRENLLQAAEKKIEARANALRDPEGGADGGVQKKEQVEAQRFKNLVTMYENMKAKDAARIFDRLEMRILVEVASQINPRRMSDILGQMSPEAAERLTVELANRASLADDRGTDAANLPKIEGTPRN